MTVGKIVRKIKAKVLGSLGKKQGSKKTCKESYSKMDKTASIKVEIQSRKAQRLIQRTLASVDGTANAKHSHAPNHHPSSLP